jgi:ATP-binding cassette subfamily B protein
MASSERIFKLLDTPATIVSPAHTREPKGAGRIEFDHVWFAYRNIPIGDGRTGMGQHRLSLTGCCAT